MYCISFSRVSLNLGWIELSGCKNEIRAYVWISLSKNDFQGMKKTVSVGLIRGHWANLFLWHFESTWIIRQAELTVGAAVTKSGRASHARYSHRAQRHRQTDRQSTSSCQYTIISVRGWCECWLDQWGWSYSEVNRQCRPSSTTLLPCTSATSATSQNSRPRTILYRSSPFSTKSTSTSWRCLAVEKCAK